jgi:hypothetical protein
MAQHGEAPHICVDRVIPEAYNPARAAAEHVAIQHARAEVMLAALPDLNADDVQPVSRLALINLKKWPNGSALTCRFLDGDATQRKKVEAKAKIWEQFANVTFKFVQSGAAQIRISFSADPGSWSAVGTDALVDRYFPSYQPTMNFGWLRDDTPDNEYERVVVHEFGHALGCIHEHQSPSEHLKWKKTEVYRVFSGAPNFWSKQDIDHNILQKYSPTGLTFTDFDKDSIMLYQFAGSLFTDGVGTPLNTQLSAKDKDLTKQMYPR